MPVQSDCRALLGASLSEGAAHIAATEKARNATRLGVISKMSECFPGRSPTVKERENFARNRLP